MQHTKQVVKAGLVFYLAVWAVLMGAIPQDATAMLAPSEFAPVSAAAQRTSDLERIQTTLETKIIAQRLSDLGLTTAEVNDRLVALSDEQIHQVAQTMDGLQPGGALILILAIIGAVVVALAIIGLAFRA